MRGPCDKFKVHDSQFFYPCMSYRLDWPKYFPRCFVSLCDLRAVSSFNLTLFEMF